MGTPLEGTHLPMRVWFTALYLVAASGKGISSVKLAEHLGIGQKTAWFLGQRIRHMMEDKEGLLVSIVEADETYAGGKARPKKQASERDPDDDQPVGRSGSRKSMVTVATEDGGKAGVAKGRTHSGRTITNFLFGNVLRDRTVLISEQYPTVRWNGLKYGAHPCVNHSKGECVRRDENAAAVAHTNTAESFCSTLKLAWIAALHWFLLKRTNRYLDEVAFLWSACKVPVDQRLQSMFVRSTERLRRKELVA